MGATRINAISAKKRYRISCKDLYRSPRREDAYARLPRHAELFELISPARKRFVSGFHIVFSTKQRTQLIPAGYQSRLWNYFAGIAHNHGMQMLAAGGTANHVYLLLVLPAETALADAVRTLKANSSRWMREASPSFTWQQGYGAFRVSPPQLHRVKRYIANQPRHFWQCCRRRTFVLNGNGCRP